VLPRRPEPSPHVSSPRRAQALRRLQRLPSHPGQRPFRHDNISLARGPLDVRFASDEARKVRVEALSGPAMMPGSKTESQGHQLVTEIPWKMERNLLSILLSFVRTALQPVSPVLSFAAMRLEDFDHASPSHPRDRPARLAAAADQRSAEESAAPCLISSGCWRRILLQDFFFRRMLPSTNYPRVHGESGPTQAPFSPGSAVRP